MAWGDGDQPTSAGYLNDDEFSLAMDSTFGVGNWSQTGGWRSQARENALRAQGAKTVAPGHVSAHSIGDPDAPGARDIVVDGLTPEQAAQKMRENGTYGANQLYPEGSAGSQGAHLHVGMQGGAQPTWGHGDAPATAWGQDDQPVQQSDKPPADGGFWQRLGGSAVGGAISSFGKLIHDLGVLGDQHSADLAAQGAETGFIVVDGQSIELTPQERAEAAEHAKTRGPTAISRGLEPAAQKVQAVGEAFAPAKRSPLESIAHGAGEMVPALGAAAINPALGAGVFATQGYAETYEDAIKHGATPQEADKAAKENAAIQGGLGALPVGEVAGAAAAGLKGAAARVGARYAAQAAGNATLMGSMQAGSNIVARQNYDPNRDWAEQVPQAMAQGALADVAIHGAHDVIGAGVNAGKTLLRPRESPASPGTSPVQSPEAMPETDAIRAYAGQGPSAAEAPPKPAAGEESTWTPEREARWQEWAAKHPGAEPVHGDPVLFQTPEGIAHGTVIGQNPDHQVVVDTPAGPVTVPPDQAVPLPKDYESERIVHGAPLEQMPQAIADAAELRQAAPKGYSLFQAMKDLGGIRTKEPDGSPIGDVADVLDKVRRPGLVNNKTGLTPDAMRAALQERGWFGAFDQSQGAEDFGEAKPGDDLNSLYEIMRREAAGKKVLHPSESGSGERRADLEDQMRQAGVALSDAPETAAAKLAAWRGEQVLARSPQTEALRERATELGLKPRDGAPYDEILADVLEREALSDEADGWTWDHGEDRTDSVLTSDEHEWLTAAGRRPEGERDPAFPAPAALGETGDRPGAQEGAEEPRAGAGGDREGPQGLSGEDQLGSERVDLANGQHDQLLIPGGERSAQQAAAAREGPLKAKAPQQDAGGLFAPPEPDQDSLKFSKPPVFYSALERHIDNSTLKAATPEQWKATIKNAPGLKKEEIEWTGVNDWLDLFGQDKVPKDALQAFIRDNGVKVEEKVLGGFGPDSVAPDEQAQADHDKEWTNLFREQEEIRKRNTLPGRAGFDLSGAEEARYAELSRAMDDLHTRMVEETLQRQREAGTASHGPAEFSDWTLPGGEDYRELLLTLPKEANPPATHWDTPGVMAHVRFDTRTAPDGKKVLFVQEIQSDWHQKGRDQGYDEGSTAEQRAAAKTAYDEALKKVYDTGHAMIATMRERGELPERVHGRAFADLGVADQFSNASGHLERGHSEESRAAVEAYRAASLARNEAAQELHRVTSAHGIPNAPFKSSWPALVMKRVIRWAADHDMDRISWTTGDQQNERYDRTTHVGRITLHDNSSGGIGRPQMEGPFNGGTLVIHDPEGRQVGEHHIRGASTPENARKALEDVIGSELTERLLAQPAREARTAGLGVRERHIEGLDVKIGGDGMRAFYDRNLVNITNDLIKKYGAKVEKTRISVEAGPYGDRLRAQMRNPDPVVAENARLSLEGLHPEQHSFDVTPQMREAASGGLPLFKRHQGAVADFRQPKGVVVGRAEPGDREAKSFADKVEAAVRKIAPFAEVVPARHITEVSTGDKAMGVSWRDGLRHIIGWSVESPDAVGIARHEAVHALREAGTIRPQEWETLEEAATNEGWRDRYNIGRRYGELTHDKQIEEAVAERFREWRRDGQQGLSGMVRTVFQRLAKLFDQVRDIAKRTFGAKATATDIFSRMESGEMGRRMGREYHRPTSPDPNAIEGDPAFARPPNSRAAERAAREAEAQREIDEREGRIVTPTAKAHAIDRLINQTLGQGVESVGRLAQRAAERALPDPIAEALEETGHAVNLAVNPMAAGSPRAQAAAKDFANALRAADFQHERLDKWLDRRFTDEQQRRMWEAADEEGVILRRGEQPGPGQGLNRLDPEERAAVLNLQERADKAFEEAQALGMVKGDGLESYVPRMIVQMTAFGPKVLERSGPRAQRRGGNLSTTTGQLRQRKYETTSETEAAAEKAFGDKATVVRNIRTLPLATQRLERAIAGRTLVQRIKELSSQTGEPLVVEGQKPNDNYFTMDHAALQVWRPRSVTDPETGKTTAAVDQNGDVEFDAHPLWIAKEFEGPLKAVLSTPSGPIVRAIAELKAKMMGVIMYSPLMHNAVIWGRALAADPVGVASLEAYRRGSRAKADPETMAQAIKAGLVPVSRHFDKIDTASIANSGATFVPGRSWTSQVLGFIPNLFSKDAGDAVKEKVDQFGDLWHNTFLWDRVGDLQMGLYVKMRDDMMRKANKFGINADTAQKIAAHYANRYAGSLPTEGMSKVARQLANWVLFSRSFTLGNMAAFKDVVKGLPSDVRGQIERDAGAQQLLNAQGVARRKAIAMLALDAAFAWGGLWLAAGATAWLTHQRFQAPDQNEDKYKNRFLLRYQADGTAVYGRLPTGKTVEDQWHWLTQPVTTLHQKLSPYGRLVSAIWSNDKGFGRKLYDPYDHTAHGVAKNVGRIVWDTMQSIAPTGQLQGLKDAVVGGPGVDQKTAALQALLPVAGITVSKGAPGGPAMGDYFAAKDQHDFQVQEALPGIQKQIRGGDIVGARQAMTELGIAPGLQNYYVRVARNPGLRMSGRKLRDFERFADDRQKAQFARDRSANAGRGQ